MATRTPPPPAPASSSTRTGIALPARLLVFVAFTLQFVTLLLGLGILIPYLHQQAIHPVVLGLGAALGFAIFQLGLGLILKLIPVRCGHCGGHGFFGGFGWWPFIYRFNCGACGMQRRIEVGGRR